ncbi:MAG: hypothetical protein EOP04_27415 [Proteobacteria bacterium]|nr:MAG: hypothetical protein EOP04_27415 [Pseudomonadota bacterium]
MTGTTFRFSDLAALNNTFSYGFGVNGLGAITATFVNGGSSLSIASDAVPAPSHYSANNTFSYAGQWTATNITNLQILKICQWMNKSSLLPRKAIVAMYSSCTPFMTPPQEYLPMTRAKMYSHLNPSPRNAIADAKTPCICFLEHTTAQL